MHKIILNLLVALFFLCSIVFAEGTKISPILNIMMSETKDTLKAVNYDGLLSINKEITEPEVDVIVKTKPNFSKTTNFKEIENIQGIKIHSKLKEYFTATVPLNQIKKLSDLAGIVFVDASVKCKKLLDASVVTTKADEVRNTLSYKGKNVVVGIVDTGIDFNHYDFRNSDGTSRIKYIWDQTISATSGESAPSGYVYGVEYNQTQINNSLGKSDVRQKDTNGHGTHVAGIAAGNGLGTGNNKPAGTYTGVATESDIIVVNTDLSSTSKIIDGISYIFSKAASLNQASVVNLSLGTHQGSHDGKSPFESSIENLIGAGKIVVAAAGNSGSEEIHCSGTSPATITFNAISSSLSYVEIWYAGTNNLNASVTSPSGTVIPAVSPGNSSTTNTPTDGRVSISSSTNISYNNDKQIVVQVDNGGGTPVKTTGTWTITLTGSGRFDAWSPTEEYTTFVTPDYDYTITMPATANKIISVASFTTKKTWKAVDDNTYSYSANETVSDISTFSSRGPSRDGRQKPDLAAPGSAIASSMSTSVAFTTASTMSDGKHVIMQGTSMAAPHVTGIVALLLQKNKNLTPDETIVALNGTTTKDSYTGSSWNKYWGNGKVNALASVNSITATTEILSPEISEHFSYPNPARGNKTTIKYNSNVNAEVTIMIYNIAGEIVAKLLGDAAPGYNKIEWDISSVAPGIYFYFINLKSRDDGSEIKTKAEKIAIIK